MKLPLIIFTGHIPLRHLVYRVHALPGSMRPLIWDFGQLNHQVETLLHQPDSWSLRKYLLFMIVKNRPFFYWTVYLSFFVVTLLSDSSSAI